MRFHLSNSAAVSDPLFGDLPGERQWQHGAVHIRHIDERHERLSKADDPLEKSNALVPWEIFRKPLVKALKRSDGAKVRLVMKESLEFKDQLVVA